MKETGESSLTLKKKKLEYGLEKVFILFYFYFFNFWIS